MSFPLARHVGGIRAYRKANQPARSVRSGDHGGKEVLMKATIALGDREETIELINLTTHPVEVYTGRGLVTIPPSTRVARCKLRREAIGEIKIGDARIPVTQNAVVAIHGLPDPRPGVYYIVSLMVASACPHRDDLLVPDAPLKDGERRTVACRSFFRGGHKAPLANLGSLEHKHGARRHGQRYYVWEKDEYNGRTSSRGTMTYHAWLQQLNEVLWSRVGRRCDAFRVRWEKYFEDGLSPEAAAAKVLDIDLFDFE